MKLLLILFCWLMVFSSVDAQQVVAAEYFIDTDNGPGNNTPVPITNPQADGTYNFMVALTGVPVGYHKMYIRTRSSEGHWSIVGRRNIEVVSANTRKSIIHGEYFFDTDPGLGDALPITIDPTDSLVLENFQATVNELPVGYHKLYIRTKDIDGNWSLTARRNVEVIQAYTSLIAGAEYFVNTDPGVGLAQKVHFPSPHPDSSFSFKIPIEELPTGTNTIYVRAYDSVHRNWSFTQWQRDSVVTSIQNGNWSEPSTWSNNKVPDANTVVLLYHQVTVDIDANCKSLTPYGSTASCIIQAGKLLSVRGKQ